MTTPIIKIVPMPGPQGATGSGGTGSADIADFVFDTVDGEESTMTIANHDMIIQTTREEDGQDADISIQSADDIWIDANGDALALYAANEISFRAGDPEQSPMTYVDGTITLPNQTKIFDAADNIFVDKTITITAETNVLGQTSNGSTATGVILAWSQDGYDLGQAFQLGRPATATITFGDDSSVPLETVYDTIFETYPSIVYQWDALREPIYPVTINATFDAPEYQRSLNINLINTNGNDNPTADWRFDNDGTLNLPAGSPKIVNSAVPGDITLSAYNGIKIEASSGFGLESNSIKTNGLVIQDAGQLYEDSNLIIESNAGYPIIIQGHQDVNIESRNGNIILNPDGSAYIGNSNSESNRIARISDITAGSTGDITFEGVKIIGAGTASGDGYNNGTIELVPDGDLESDQYLIIDPTTPNHIHIRAGGTQDASSADLILGGERNNVIVSDGGRVVAVNTRPDQIINSYNNESVISGTQFVTSDTSDIQIGYTVNINGTDYVVDAVDFVDEGVIGVTASGAVFEAETSYTFTFNPDYENQWVFAPDGALYGPAMGALRVASIMNVGTENVGMYANDADIFLEANAGTVSITATDVNIGSNSAPSTLNINTYSGAVINSHRTSTYDAEDKVVATLGDVELSIANAASGETSFAVNGGALGTQPTFTGAPLFSGTYVKIGPQVHFQIQVDMDNILTFGTGQYYIDLPFDSKYGYQFKEGCLHHIATSNQYAIGGHVAAGTNRLFLTYTGSNGQDEMFDYNSPVTLAVADNFHIAGTYISQ